MKKINTLFIGSGYFAVEIFKGLKLVEEIQINAVVTQPDKPAGRKHKISYSELKTYLIKTNNKAKIFQPESIKNEADKILAAIKPELIFVCDYGQIVPESLINYPRHKCLNVHGSMLPDLRGAVPAQMAILKGYDKTGVSIVVMTPRMDDGEIICSKEVAINPKDNAKSLRLKLAREANKLLSINLLPWIKGKLTAKAQDHSKATYSFKKDIAKEKAQILPDTSAVQADRMIRAFYPWPVAWALIKINNKLQRIKIYQASLDTGITAFPIGRFFKYDKKLYLQLNKGALELEAIQLEGKDKAVGSDYMFLKNTEIIA